VTKYIKLSDEERGIEINISFGQTVGAWTNRNPESLEIGKKLVKDVQRRCFHNRDTMSNPKKWYKHIDRYVELYKLSREDY
jgi:hypothetical protein